MPHVSLLSSRALWYLIRRRRHYLNHRGEPHAAERAVADVEATLLAVRDTPAGEQALGWFSAVVDDWLAVRHASRTPAKRKARRNVEAFRRQLERVA